MRPLLFVFPIVCMIIVSCNTHKGLLGKQTAHQKYSSRLKEAGLASSKLGMLWFNAASAAIKHPLPIELPFQEKGFFPAEDPIAAGFAFEAKKGELVVAEIITTPGNGFQLFTEFYSLQNGSPELLMAADTSARNLKYEIEKSGRYLIRIQTELLHSVGYTLIIKTSPSLAFPVPAIHKPKIGSFWGANRDGGSRSHEGIDIFAPKRTPAVAVAPGRVGRVTENRLGGKVVFMRPDGKNINLYYAHLDEQMVTDGQRVNTGDVIGLIGNTGNASTTAPHLHFGIYTNGGAVDPLPFVDKNRSEPPSVKGKITNFSDTLTIISQAKSVSGNQLPAGLPVRVLAASGNEYKVKLPDGNQEYINTGLLTTRSIRIHENNNPTELLSHPDNLSAVKGILPKGKFPVLGVFNNFLLIKNAQFTGWIRI